jgi:CRP-like cAMP-binding protein
VVEPHSCLWYIKSLSFFPQLSEPEMMELAARSEMLDVPKGEAFTVRNAETGYVYLLKLGRMRSVRPVGDGRKVALDILSPGDVVGATAIVSGGADSESFEAMEPCLVCRIRGEVLESLLEQNGQVGLSVMHRVGLRKRKIESRLLDMVFCTVPVRVARLLLEFGEQFGEKTSKGVLINLKLTHQELADLIGANREAATRALSLLLDAGAIGYQGKLILIRDSGVLAAAAKR